MAKKRVVNSLVFTPSFQMWEKMVASARPDEKSVLAQPPDLWKKFKLQQ